MKLFFNHHNITVDSGFSDKLRIVTFFIAINKLRNNKNKKIYFFDIKTKGCPYRFIDNFSIKNYKIKTVNTKPKDIFSLNPYNSQINLKNCKVHNIYKNIDNKKLLNNWKNSYTKIIPGKIIKKKIKKIQLPKKYIGIHIRSTDRLIYCSSFIKDIQHKDMIFDLQLNNFKKKIANIIASKNDIKNIYIASDDYKIKKELINNLKKNNFNVYYNNNKFFVQRFRQTTGQDFAVDLACLAKSQLILTTTGAGVTDTAYLMSNQKIKIYKYINQINRFFFLRVLTLFIFFSKIFFNKIKNYFLKSILLPINLK
jgi:hypothetical protein